MKTQEVSMTGLKSKLRCTVVAAGLALVIPAGVLAAQTGSSSQGESPTQGGSASQAQSSSDWQTKREKTVSAQELMGADVYNVATLVGNVRDLVLSEDGSRVEYVLYEIPYPYVLHGASNGYAAFENLAVGASAGGLGRDLRFAGDASPEDPQTLEITRAEADNRLLSRVLGQTVTFSGDETRPLEDVLIDRESGKITGYVVNEDPDAWFNEAPRVVPPDQVTIGDDGNVTAETEFAALEPVR
jgi:uncharacterized protein YrrD